MPGETFVRPWIVALAILAAWAASAVGPYSPVQAPIVRAAGDFTYGVIVDTTNPRSMRLARQAGFTHAKMIIRWPSVEPRRGRYRWEETAQNDLDNVIKAARGGDMRLIVRVDGVPGWAGGSPADADLDAVTRFYEAMADHGKGVIIGYEVLNEPNLPQEWGGPPDPAAYTAFLKAASRGVKRADRGAVVIGGGLSQATGGLGGTIDDLDFIRGMYAAGAGGAMDALAVHNYGGSFEPERDPRECGVCFRRAELYREIMVEQGDAATPIWATEFGWLLDPGRGMGQYDWMKVSADRQAEYLVRAFRYARGNWPWMTGMLLSNLDASTSPYHQSPHDGMPWYAILNPDHSPRAAYRALKDIPKDAAGLPLP
ncbi:MAG: glycoside hydrolase family 5 protein, partial [Chloroflexota bacterium]|nr:glycoside hydrolase family 5 protein [Chloroflexota bacterium]